MPTHRCYNPFDPAFRADPYPFYDRLRTTSPAHVTPMGLTVITRYDDVVAHAAQQRLQPRRRRQRHPRDDPIFQRRRERRNNGAKTILNLDPPDHTRLRRLVSARRSHRRRSSASGRASRSRSTPCSTRCRTRRDGARRRARLPGAVPGDLRPARPPDRDAPTRSASGASSSRSLEPTSTLETPRRRDAAVGQLMPYLVAIVEPGARTSATTCCRGCSSAEDEGDTSEHRAS